MRRGVLARESRRSLRQDGHTRPGAPMTHASTNHGDALLMRHGSSTSEATEVLVSRSAPAGNAACERLRAIEINA